MLYSDRSNGCYTENISLPPPPTKNLNARSRAQRAITPSRVQKLVRFILENPDTYVIPAITVVINSDVDFEPVKQDEELSSLGTLKVPLTADVNVVDGQHRCAAISEVVSHTDDYSDESIGVMFFVNRDLKSLQQMFADLNRHASKPTKAIGILFEHRELLPRITKAVIDRVEAFRGFVNEERNTLNKTSGKLFTINAIYDATIKYLLRITERTGEDSFDHLVDRSVEFWTEVDRLIPQWRAVRENMLSASEVREDYIHTQSVSLCAMGMVGNYLFRNHPEDWKEVLGEMRGLNWSRTNYETWEGRCIEHNQIRKANVNIVLTSNAIKKKIGAKLNDSEQLLEDDLERRKT